MVQYLVLAHAQEHPALLEWTDNMRLLDTAAACAVLSVEDAAALQAIYIEYRTLLHRLALDKASYQLTASSLTAQRQKVTAVWNTLFTGLAAPATAGNGAPELS